MVRRSTLGTHVAFAVTLVMLSTACDDDPQGRLSESGTESVAVATTPPPGTAPHATERDHMGCLDNAGSTQRPASYWYPTDSGGFPLAVQPGAEVAVANVDVVDAIGPSAAGRLTVLGPVTMREIQDPDRSCVIERRVQASPRAGESLWVTASRPDAPVALDSLMHIAPFEPVGPDVFVSASPETGDVGALCVRPDGTSVHALALGVDAVGFGGWPTTTTAPADLQSQPPTPTVNELIEIACSTADWIVTNR